ncbi:MAG: hypothetical protein NVV73_03430, partial [Cellvibrionaceae bacterium]|nr:hypothetical protein [Cellvibrionaceae bacterium]
MLDWRVVWKSVHPHRLMVIMVHPHRFRCPRGPRRPATSAFSSAAVLSGALTSMVLMMTFHS